VNAQQGAGYVMNRERRRQPYRFSGRRLACSVGRSACAGAMPEPSPEPHSTIDTGDRQRLRPSGGYRTLRSFQTSTLVYDATVAFCARFMNARSRTVDQMVQAARSGRQNIAEGSRASATSSQTELRLVNVARASLDELLLDYEDFLRQRGLRLWRKDDAEAREVRAVGRGVGASHYPSDPADPSDQSDPPAASPYARWLDHQDPAIVANTILCLIHQTNYLLDQQIAALERDFVSGGGYTEQLAAARLAERRKQAGQPAAAPACPLCHEPLVVRTARSGPRAGAQFWGCSAYPKCRGTRAIES
jgi:restriction system protein